MRLPTPPISRGLRRRLRKLPAPLPVAGAALRSLPARRSNRGCASAQRPLMHCRGYGRILTWDPLPGSSTVARRRARNAKVRRPAQRERVVERDWEVVVDAETATAFRQPRVPSRATSLPSRSHRPYRDVAAPTTTSTSYKPGVPPTGAAVRPGRAANRDRVGVPQATRLEALMQEKARGPPVLQPRPACGVTLPG